MGVAVGGKVILTLFKIIFNEIANEWILNSFSKMSHNDTKNIIN